MLKSAIAEAEKDKSLRLHAYNTEVATAKADCDIAYELQNAKDTTVVNARKNGNRYCGAYKEN